MVLFEPQIRELERKLTEELQRREAEEIAQEIAAGVDAYYVANPDTKRDLSEDLAICERWDIGNPNLDNEFFRLARTGWPIAIRRALDAEDRCHTLEAEVSAAWREIEALQAEVERLKRRVNALRRLLRQCSPGINYDKTESGGYLWRAVMDELHNEKDEVDEDGAKIPERNG